MGEKKPNFFIVGAPKCGTTAMYSYLEQHPDIFMPQIKEPNYFCSDLTATPPYRIADEQHYFGLFAPAADETRVGEASVWYLYSQIAASRIHERFPNAQIIVMLRNPVDTMFSLHRHRYFAGYEDIEDFSAALAAEPERKRGERIPQRAQLVEGLFYREVVSFTEQVRRYLLTFGRERVHIILFDDLAKNASQVLVDALSFLEVDADFTPDLGVVNPGRETRSAAVHNLLRRPPESLAKVVKGVLPAQTRNHVRRALASLNIAPGKRTSLAHETATKLKAEFRDEVDALSHLIQRDLSKWVT